MSVALDLLAREVALLFVLGALGSGFVSFLPAGVPALARITLAPALGLAFAAAVLASVAEVLAMDTAAWAVLVPLALASVAVAAWRARRSGARLAQPAKLAFPAAVVVVVLGGLNAPLVASTSLGPMTYTVGDASVYVTFQALLRDRTLAESDLPSDLSPRAVFGDLIDTYSEELPASESREAVRDLQKVTNLVPVGATTTASATGSLFGWRALDFHSAFLAGLVLIGALAAFGFCLWLTRSAWAASAAALLMAGPVTYQLYIDSSEAALAAIALLPVLAFLATLLLARGDWTSTVLLGITFAGFQATYPLWLPGVGLWTLLVIGVAAIRAHRAGRLNAGTVRRAAARMVVIAAIAIALSPVAFERGVTFIHLMATTDLLEHLATVSLPPYDLAVEVIPGWLLGMREFYSLPRPENAGSGWVLTGVVAPAAMIAVAALGAWHFRRAWILVALVPIAIVLAYQSWATVGCSYCVQRNLLPLVPVISVLFGLGLVGITRLGRRVKVSPRVLRATAVGIGLVVLAIAGLRDSQLARRVIAGGYTMNADARDVTLGHTAGLEQVHLEGPEATGNPLVEANALYQAVEEATGSFPSVAPTSVYISVFGGRPNSSVSYDPRHEYIMTRLAGVDTGRETLYRAGPYAVQRAKPLDVTVEGGVIADLAHRDPAGRAWVHGPLKLFVTSDSARPASIRLELRGPGVEAIPKRRGFEIVDRGTDRATLCVPVSRADIGRATTVDLDVEPAFGPPDDEYSNVGTPDPSLLLEGMRATTVPCKSGEAGGRR